MLYSSIIPLPSLLLIFISNTLEKIMKPHKVQPSPPAVFKLTAFISNSGFNRLTNIAMNVTGMNNTIYIHIYVFAIKFLIPVLK